MANIRAAAAVRMGTKPQQAMHPSEGERVPLYEYRCTQCGHLFEKIQSYSAADGPCPRCAGAVERLLSAPAIQFKGSGFYLTDYGKGGAAGAAKGGPSGNSGEPGAGSAGEGGKSAAGAAAPASSQAGAGASAGSAAGASSSGSAGASANSSGGASSNAGTGSSSSSQSAPGKSGAGSSGSS